VITGFRLGSGGAQARFDVRPDITCFGKVIGGGLPIGAVGGSAAVMEHLSPIGPVFHAGTLSGNPIATAAGLAALDTLTPDVYIELMARTRHLSALLRDACEAADFDATFPVVGTLLGIVCGSRGHGEQLRRCQADRRTGLRGLLPRDARRGRGDGSWRVRGAVRRPRTQRRRARCDRRGRPSGRRRRSA
jgi:glutamate-1-semialdehyde aminotransferase